MVSFCGHSFCGLWDIVDCGNWRRLASLRRSWHPSIIDSSTLLHGPCDRYVLMNAPVTDGIDELKNKLALVREFTHNWFIRVLVDMAAQKYLEKKKLTLAALQDLPTVVVHRAPLEHLGAMYAHNQHSHFNDSTP